MKLSRSPMFDNRSPMSVSGRLLAICLLAGTIGAAGCRQDMHNTPVGQPLRESLFAKNVSTSRAPVEGTVARGTLQDDAAFFTGKEGGAAVNALPFPLTAEVLDRGEQQAGGEDSQLKAQRRTLPVDAVPRGTGASPRRGTADPPAR